ncbi:hypothetical protein [Streptomyces xanthophaeus]
MPRDDLVKAPTTVADVGLTEEIIGAITSTLIRPQLLLLGRRDALSVPSRHAWSAAT